MTVTSRTTALTPPHCRNCSAEVVLSRDDDLCNDCGRWIDYWDSLTDQEKQAEQSAMDAYAARWAS
jgi:predicted amidophosphoribosyltransferase